MAVEQNEYFINFDNAKVNVQLEGRRKQAKWGGDNTLILQRREWNDPVNSREMQDLVLRNLLAGVAGMKGGEEM